jgi:aminoglycoside phosphotransferase (APT) family kinase protein
LLTPEVVGAERLVGWQRLSGGASRETWSFDAVMADGSVRGMVLRRDRPGALGVAPERELLLAAAAQGVPVPAVIAGGQLDGVPFLVTERVEGETIARRILRDDALAGARERLAAQCGAALAGIHRIPVDAVPGLAGDDQLVVWRSMLDGFTTAGEAHPAFELAFRWLADHRPPPTRRVVVHGDFRNGNLVVGPDGLRAVLDWELAHVGDAMEDLGWLCVKAWRFGVDDRPVGGFGSLDDLLAAYSSAAGGPPVDPAVVRWWEVLGTLKWGIMCIAQAFAHLSGAARSVELAAIGRRVCENEWDLLELIA